MTHQRVISILMDIKEHCQYIVDDTMDMNFEEFVNNRLVRQATERNLTVIGISAIRIRDTDSDFYEELPALYRTVGLRNRLAHGYGIDIDNNIIWETVSVSVPELLSEVNRLISVTQ